jgi:hypothetical protein
LTRALTWRDGCASGSRVLWDWPHRDDITGICFSEALRRTRRGRLIDRCPPLRALALWRAAQRIDVLVIGLAGSTSRILLALERLSPRSDRYLVLLHFIPEVERVPAHTRRAELLGTFKATYLRLVVGPVVRRSVLRCQVLTRWEAGRNSAYFGVAEEMMTITRYPLRQAADATPPRSDVRGVLASGRAACDWDTVFAAAELGDWPLTVICGHRDLPRLHQLNRRRRAEILVDVSLTEHEARMRGAQVYLLALRDHQVSSGQIRLSDAVRAGTPAVVARVPGIAEYLDEGETALVYEPGDAAAAARQIQRLIDEPELGPQLSASAFAAAGRWTREDYRLAVQQIVAEAALAKAGGLPPH